MPRRILGDDRRTERATQIRMMARIANQFRGSIAREISGAMRDAADQYEQDGTDASIGSAIQARRGALEAQFRGDYTAAFDTFGKRVFDAALKFHGRGFERKQSAEEAFEERKRQYLAEHVASQVEKIARTTEWQTREIIARALRDGEGIDKIARRVRDEASGVATRRANVIARTETHAATQAAQTEAAKASQVATLKGWISALDDRTRDDVFDHVAADGESVALSDRFTGTGESLDHPGDVGGSPGNIILCRCGQELLADI